MSEERKRLGAWYTPPDLVTAVVAGVIDAGWLAARPSATVRVLDPACGDGRLLVAAARRITDLGRRVEMVGVDIDPAAVIAARGIVPEATVIEGDALDRPWDGELFDLVIGNPPYLSQLASATTRGGAGGRGVGTYGDAAVEFLALGAELVDPHGGRLAMILPQSILASRDAANVRHDIDGRATLVWSFWSPVAAFEAQVLTCALAFEFATPTSTSTAGPRTRQRARGNWAGVVTDRQQIPTLPELRVDGTLGDRATLNANFRDQYYGLIGAVVGNDDVSIDRDEDSPALITSGLIDPGCSRWEERPITFNRQRIARPRVNIAALDEAMRRWAQRRLVPKVLVANQTAIIEALADPDGALLPAVPVIGVYPAGSHWDERAPLATLFDAPADEPRADAESTRRAVWEIAAVLTSPVASAWLWHERAGTGLSAGTVRASPAALGELPWPAGSLDVAVDALRARDVRSCGQEVDRAYGIAVEAPADDALYGWWATHLARIERRAGA